MIVFLNGQFVSEEKALVSVFDRSFLYGDGLFETLRIYGGQPFRWRQHLERLQRGAAFLKIQLPLSVEELYEKVRELIQVNQMAESVLRITLSRGVGQRGYLPKGADRPNFVLSLHPALQIDPASPPRWRLITSSFRVAANDPLAHHKTCNKLHQVMARAEAESLDADEALLLNTDGEVAEASSSNLFWIEGRAIHTPPVVSGILPGVTREAVVEVCQSLGLDCRESRIRTEPLRDAEALFLSMTTLGVVECILLDGVPLKQSSLTGQIREAYRELVEREIRAC
jgi:branched-chain amino acid aminotransferase